MSTENKSFKRKLVGKVVSDKSANTVVVSVTRRFKHPLYSKFVHESKKYHAHDAEGIAKAGDTVQIIESKPYSKLKKWQLVKVL
jgi:small subunit ribosomal protein S17